VEVSHPEAARRTVQNITQTAEVAWESLAKGEANYSWEFHISGTNLHQDERTPKTGKCRHYARNA
jgi:hypothetical protein